MLDYCASLPDVLVEMEQLHRDQNSKIGKTLVDHGHGCPSSASGTIVLPRHCSKAEPRD